MSGCQHPSCQSTKSLLRECQITRTRAGGPGGQHRNKVESAIVVTHSSGIAGQASERRSQHENRNVAVFRLRVNLAIQLRCEPPQPSPDSLWESRCRGGKISVAADNDDFPCLLAQALDFVVQENYQLADAAKKLGCSTSQLIKLLKIENLAFQMVNSERKKIGLSTLK